MELMKNMVTHAAESTTARPLLELVEAIGLFLIDAGEGQASPRASLSGWFTGQWLCDARLVGPKLDTLVLEVVVGKGSTAAGLGGEVAHHIGEAAIDLDGVAGGKSERLDARNMTALAISLTSPMRRVAMRRLRLFSTSGSA